MISSKPNSSRIPFFNHSHIISHEAVNIVTEKVLYGKPLYHWKPGTFVTEITTTRNKNLDVNIEYFCAPVIHPITGKTITKYQKLVKDLVTRDIWSTSFGKEFGNVAQEDDKKKTPGTCSIFEMTNNKIRHIPQDRVITYARLLVDFRPQKDNPNRVRITAGGNLIKYPGELTTRTADMNTAKILWNSILSTKGARLMGLDIKLFYLGTPLDRFEYMKIPITLFPAHIRLQ